jgi:hypothetical protein
MSSKRNLTEARNSRVANERAMWSSAPVLNFDMEADNNSDDFSTFNEPDFSKSFQDLDFDGHFDNIKDEASKRPNPFRASESAINSRIKVRSKDTEIKDLLFSKWKTNNKKPTVINWHSESPGKEKASRIWKKTQSNDEIRISVSRDSSPTKIASPKPKKKIAVKLKASDLDLTEEQRKAVEKMFRKLQHNPQTRDHSVQRMSSDQRWFDEQKQQSLTRPKPATRQLSLDKEDIDLERPNASSGDDTMSAASSQIMERRRSRDRERSRSRHARTSKSKSRSPSGERSTLRSPSERICVNEASARRSMSRSPSPQRIKLRSASKHRGMSRSPSPQRCMARSPSEHRSKPGSRAPDGNEPRSVHRRFSRSDSTEHSTRTRSTSRGPSLSSEPNLEVRRQNSLDSTDSCSTGSSGRPRRTSSRIRRFRSKSEDR